MHGPATQECVFKLIYWFDSDRIASLLFISPELLWLVFVLLFEVKHLSSNSVLLCLVCCRKCDGQSTNMSIRGNQVNVCRYTPQNLQRGCWRRRQWLKCRAFKRRVLDHNECVSQQQRKLCQAKHMRIVLRI